MLVLLASLASAEYQAKSDGKLLYYNGGVSSISPAVTWELLKDPAMIERMGFDGAFIYTGRFVQTCANYVAHQTEKPVANCGDWIDYQNNPSAHQPVELFDCSTCSTGDVYNGNASCSAQCYLNRFYFRVTDRTPLNYSLFKPVFDDYAKLSKQSQFWRNSMPIIAVGAEGGVDVGHVSFYNDSDWDIVLANVRSASKLVREAGFKGVVLDPEYGPTARGIIFNYTQLVEYSAVKGDAGAGKSFTEFEDKARERGRQFMQAWNAEYPNITIGSTFLTSLFGDEIFNYGQPLDRSALEQSRYGLMPAFVDGMLDAATPEAEFFDGAEVGYALTAQYRPGKRVVYLYNRVAGAFSADLFSLDPARYWQRVSPAIPMWVNVPNDDTCQLGWAACMRFENAGTWFTVPEIADNLRQRERLSGKYAWAYFEGDYARRLAPVPDDVVAEIVRSRTEAPEGNTPPVLLALAPVGAVAGERFEYVFPDAVDYDSYTTRDLPSGEVYYLNDTPLVEVASLPLGAFVQSGAKRVVWTPSLSDLGVNEIVFRATDGYASADSVLSVNVSASLQLQSGWNLVGVPVNASVSVPASCVVRAWNYSSGSYAEFVPSKLAGGSGYWLWANSSCSIGLSSKDAAGGSGVKLSTGWNLVSSPASSLSVGSCNEVALGYDGAGYSPVTSYVPGRAYWAYSAKDCTLALG